jgi:hypothetical protein
MFSASSEALPKPQVRLAKPSVVTSNPAIGGQFKTGQRV